MAQCKHARIRKGVLLFNTCSVTNRSTKTYEGQVEAFGVYCADDESVYLVPVADVPVKRRAYLRLMPAHRRSNKTRTKDARPYIIHGGLGG